MKPIIRVENLSKKYQIGAQAEPHASLRDALTGAARAPLKWLQRDGRRPATETFWALKDVNFEVMPGEVIGIIGRNGAGKSTLLKILSRITEPTDGRVELYGRIASLLEVGTGFHPELSGRENIYLNGAILGMRKTEIDRQFDAIVAFAEMEKFIDTPVKHYSSGMYVRLAFAVAAHLEPEILVVDEVLAVGDARFQRRCLDKMQDVNRQGRTVIFVSHDMQAVTRLCERAILLEDGRVQQDSFAHEAVRAYMHSGTGTPAVREWAKTAGRSGDGMVRLCAARVRNRDGHVVEAIDIREPVQIEIEYYNYSNTKFPFANIQLYSENGVCIFASGDFTNLDWRHHPRTFTGQVKSTCTIPGNFLSEGQMSVLVALTTHNPTEVLMLERDAVSFLVVDNSDGDGARGEYVGHYPGVIRPILDWNVEYTQETQ